MEWWNNGMMEKDIGIMEQWSNGTVGKKISFCV
jgi:hypothetical protein